VVEKPNHPLAFALILWYSRVMGNMGDKVVIGDLTYRELLVAAFAAAGCPASEAVSEADKAIGLLAARQRRPGFGVVNVCGSGKGERMPNCR